MHTEPPVTSREPLTRVLSSMVPPALGVEASARTTGARRLHAANGKRRLQSSGQTVDSCGDRRASEQSTVAEPHAPVTGELAPHLGDPHLYLALANGDEPLVVRTALTGEATRTTVTGERPNAGGQTAEQMRGP